ncbi:MAG TPA: ABC transporter permease [Candidatus Sulfomarinibacteraceae bacterium]|nr:ABC transporter permease [Candidatus Sulfomarinibacteraceae bacterium]
MAESTAAVSSLPAHADSQQTRGYWEDTLYRLLKHRLGMLGAILVTGLILVALVGPYVAPYEPTTMNFEERFASPSLRHPMGADDFGRDTLTRVVYGARVSLQVGAIAVGSAAPVGSTLGLIAGYAGRVLDEIIMRAMDVLFAFPAILLAIAILAALGKGVANAMIAIGIVYIPIFARIARSSVLTIREEEFIEAARSCGATDARILFHHILPNAMAPLIVETSLSLAFAILAEAALSFFGLSVQPPDPSWGRMLSEGRAYFQQSPWMAIFPGLAIMITVMGFNFLGDGLRDAMDPSMRGNR